MRYLSLKDIKRINKKLIDHLKWYAFAVLLGFLFALIIFLTYSYIFDDSRNRNVLVEANKAYESHLYTKAFNLYLEAQKLHPSEKLIYVRLANIAFQKGLNDFSIQNFQKFLDLGGDLDQESRSRYGQLLFERKDYESLIKIFESHEITDKDKYLLARAYLSLKDIERYKSILNQISGYKEAFWDLQVFEYNIDALYSNLGTISNLPTLGLIINNRDFRVYSDLISRAKVQKDQGNIEYANLLRLTAFVNINSCDLIESDLNNLRAEFKSKKLSMQQLDLLEGKCANFRGDWNKAISLIEPLISWDKANMEYREELAYSYHLKGDREKVLQIYKEILLIQKNSRIFENYAFYLYEYDLKKDSLENLKNSFELSNEDIDRNRLAKNILKISILDLADLNICINTKFDEHLNLDDIESLILKSICDLKNGKELEFFEPSYIFYYFMGLKNNDHNQINQALDKDSNGLLIKYHLKISKLKF